MSLHTSNMHIVYQWFTFISYYSNIVTVIYAFSGWLVGVEFNAPLDTV